MNNHRTMLDKDVREIASAVKAGEHNPASLVEEIGALMTSYHIKREHACELVTNELREIGGLVAY